MEGEPLKRSIVTFDLDSTLADTRHRHHMIKPEGTDWKAYSLACRDDAPIWPAINMLRAFAASHDIWIISGRDHAAYDMTMDWLYRHLIEPAGVILQTRWAAHVYPDHLDYKLAMVDRVEQHTAQQVVLHVDDWPPVVKHLLAHGRDAVCISSPQHLANFNPEGIHTYV